MSYIYETVWNVHWVGGGSFRLSPDDVCAMRDGLLVRINEKSMTLYPWSSVSRIDMSLAGKPGQFTKLPVSFDSVWRSRER